MFRVVDTDNFGGDWPDERWASPWVFKRETAEAIAKALNEEQGPEGPRYFTVVERGYVLQPGFRP